MASSKNPLLFGVSGAIGKQLVVRQMNGKTFLCAYPDMEDVKFTPKQREVQQRMVDADKAVKKIMKDPAERDAAQLRLNVPKQKLYTSLIREFFQKAKEEKSKK